jgi:hypothetical protein
LDISKDISVYRDSREQLCFILCYDITSKEDINGPADSVLRGLEKLRNITSFIGFVIKKFQSNFIEGFIVEMLISTP